MRRTASLALAAIFALSSPLYAQVQPDGEMAPNDGPPALDDSFKANTLQAACYPAAGLDQNAKALADQMCTSYLRGLTEGMYVMGLITGGGRLCLPKSDPVSVGDARVEFQDYLVENPDAGEHAAGLAAIIGILKANPCE